MLRLYSLLAGRPHFAHPHSNESVMVLVDVDWIRVFGAYMWYLTDYGSSLSDVLRAYSRAWHSDGDRMGGGKPVPPCESDFCYPHHSPLPANFPPGEFCVLLLTPQPLFAFLHSY